MQLLLLTGARRTLLLRLLAALALLGVCGVGVSTVAGQDQQEADAPRSPSGASKTLAPLPWEKKPAEMTPPLFRPPANALEILERYDIGKSQFAGFFNNQPLSRSEEDVLVKILYRFSRFGLDNLQRWRVKGVSWDQLAAAPADHRGEIYHLRGRVKYVQKQLLSPEQSSRYEFSHYYFVRMQLDDSPHTALICARHVPSNWPLDTPMDERAATDGMFLKLGYERPTETEPGDPTQPLPLELPDELSPSPHRLDELRLIFAAGRVAWLPDRVEPKNLVSADHVLLADHGVDFGLFEGVRAGNAKPIGDADREAFYEVLHALGQLQPAELRRPQIAEPIDIGPLLNTDPALHGQIMPVRGTARRIIKVLVDDQEIRRRFGIDHYYEIDLFLPLGDARVLLGKDRTGEDNPVYQNGFPATLVALRLPAGLEADDNIREMVRADAVFFKVWSYRSNYTTKFGKYQPAPMFLCIEPTRMKELAAEPNMVAEIMVGVSMGLAVLVLIVIFWWFRRGDREYQRERTEQLSEPTKPPDFSQLST
jgi:hypothetical protein